MAFAKEEHPPQEKIARLLQRHRSTIYREKKRGLVINKKGDYAHPFSSFGRGSNENANRLIRRILPKKCRWQN